MAEGKYVGPGERTLALFSASDVKVGGARTHSNASGDFSLALVPEINLVGADVTAAGDNILITKVGSGIDYVEGQTIEIVGTVNYNGTYTVGAVVLDTSFVITATLVGTEIVLPAGSKVKILKALDISNTQFVVGKANVAGGTIKVIDTLGNVEGIPLTHIEVWADTPAVGTYRIVLGDKESDFASTDEVLAVLLGPEVAGGVSHVIDLDDLCPAASATTYTVIDNHEFLYMAIHTYMAIVSAGESIIMTIYGTLDSNANNLSTNHWVDISEDVFGPGAHTVPGVGGNSDESVFAIDTPTPFLKYMIRLVGVRVADPNHVAMPVDVWVKLSK